MENCEQNICLPDKERESRHAHTQTHPRERGTREHVDGMQGPEQDLLLHSGYAVSPRADLKQSARVRIEALPTLICEAVDSALAVAAVAAAVGNREKCRNAFAAAALDKSIFKRPEFTVTHEGKEDVQSNKGGAFVGDAYLTLGLALNAFRSRSSPGEYQGLRSQVTQAGHIAATYDRVFGDSCVIVCWKGQPGEPSRDAYTVKMKAEYMEAVIGFAYMTGEVGLANALRDACLHV